MVRRSPCPVVLFVLFGLLVPTAMTASAQPVPDQDAMAIRQVIENQLDALRRDDWAEAFGYAAPSIQRKFGSPDGFREMVLGGYTIVHRPRSVSFESLGLVQGRLAQTVHMVGRDGIAALVIYFMARQADGSWRIAGVSIQRLADRSV